MFLLQALSNEAQLPRDFCSILRASVSRDSTTKAVCVHCKQYSPVRNRRAFSPGAALPPVLTLTAAVHSAETLDDFWVEKGAAGKPFLVPSFKVAEGAAAGEEVRISVDGPGEGQAASTYELRVSSLIWPTRSCMTADDARPGDRGGDPGRHRRQAPRLHRQEYAPSFHQSSAGSLISL